MKRFIIFIVLLSAMAFTSVARSTESSVIRKGMPAKDMPCAPVRVANAPEDSEGGVILSDVILTSSTPEVAGATAVHYARDCYSKTWLGLFFTNSISSELRFANDGSAVYIMDIADDDYMRDLRGEKAEQTWLKATSLGNGVYELKSGQWVYASGETNLYFAAGAYTEDTKEVEILTSWNFVLSEDGSFSPEPLTDGRRLYFCILDAEGNVANYLVDTSWRKVGDLREPEIPVTAEVKEYILTCHTNLYMKDRRLFIAKVAMDGNDVYMSGLSESSQESVVKGTRNGNTITFQSGQICDKGPLGYYMYELDAATVDFENLTDYGYPTLKADKPTEWIFEIDEEKNEIRGAEDLAIMEYMWGYPDANFNTCKSDILLSPYMDCTKQPKAIENLGYSEYNDERDVIWFDYSDFSVDGLYIKPSELYYSIYFDGEPMKFTPTDFPSLNAEGTLLPVAYYDDEYIFGYASPTSVTIRFPKREWQSLGVTLTHVHPDGRTESEMVVIENPNSALEGVSVNGEAVRTEYYNALGARIESPSKGSVVIVRTIMSDGTVKTEKRIY